MNERSELERERAKERREKERENEVLPTTYLKFSPTIEVTYTFSIDYHSLRLLHSEFGVGLRRLNHLQSSTARISSSIVLHCKFVVLLLTISIPSSMMMNFILFS